MRMMMMCMMNSYSLPMPIMVVRWKDLPWWWSPVVNPPCCLDWIRKLVTSPRQGKTQVNSRLPPVL
ncbi:hypothetical protein AYX13_06367 [Cryptococcus neoformans]|nr:hypothetical protein AYX13_06367 [Cryptococcus neoformans var. grubii]